MFSKFGFKAKPLLEFACSSKRKMENAFDEDVKDTSCEQEKDSTVVSYFEDENSVEPLGMDAEDRLRHVMSSIGESPTPAKSCEDIERKDNCSRNNVENLDKHSDNVDSPVRFTPVKRTIDSYSRYQTKAKRRRVVLLESDDDVEISSPSKISASNFYTEETSSDKIETNLNETKELDDADKLRNIYENISEERAEEVLEATGSLTDAILYLADTFEKEDTNPRAKHEEPIVVEEDSSEDESCDMSSEQRIIFSFFQEASVADIAIIPRCSEKKAAEIIQTRPFENYHDLIKKVDSIKGISTKIVDDSLQIINEQNAIKQLMKKCEFLSRRIQTALDQNTSSKKDGDNLEIEVIASNPVTKQPKILNEKMVLKHYQIAGLNWLVTLHKEGVNGILADQMGLGKTIQALAFIGYLIENGDPGPHVIIVPSSTCDNWVREIDTWLPSVNYVNYRGSQEERYEIREEIFYGENKFNIIIVSYNMAVSTPKDRALFRKLDSHYLILDEGHMLKNMKSQRYKHLMDIKAKRRLLLTGTPLQNNLLELMSLLSFIMPDLFGERLFGINLLFGSKQKSSYEKKILETAKSIMKPFFLRRLKENVLKDLPKKIEHVITVELTQKQRLIYDSLVSKYRSLVGQKLDYTSALGILMKLRKTACHPLLQRHLYDDEKLSKMTKDYVKQYENSECSSKFVLEDMEVMSDFELHNLCCDKYYLSQYRLQTDDIVSSAKFQHLDILLPDLKEQASRVLLFSQFTSMLDIIEPYLRHRKYQFLRLDGQTPVIERQALIDKYNNNSNIFVFLLSTKAGGLGINLTSADAVILHDIDFNPYNDKQAEDRCHRVGQQKDVKIYKLISKSTIEEGMLECANNKLNLEKHIAGNIDDEDNISKNVVNYLMENL